jgi:cytochrome P450
MTLATRSARAGQQHLEWHRTMRDTNPVWHNPRAGVWNVYRYQDVATVLADHQTFSSDFSVVFSDSSLFDGHIAAMDPPRHDQLRSLVSKAFTPRAIAALEGRIGELTEELLDRTGERTRIELVSELAYPLPVIVIAELLGVPATDRPHFKEWADALFAQSPIDPRDEATIARVGALMRTFHDYFREHVARRRAEPREDLLSGLVAAEVEGRRLSDGEIVGFATLLLLAGHITTTLLLGNAIICLDEHPVAQAALRADPRAIPMAIEEVLRYRSPVATDARVTATEVQLGGQVIGPRQVVRVSLQSANHDERAFPNPDAFVIDRHPNPHLAFGKGIHFCLGAPLARLEARIALGILLRRYSRIGLDPECPPRPHLDPDMNGVQTLPLLVDPA